MKNILKTTIFAFLLISLSSCTNDKSPVPSANGFAMRDASSVPPPAVLLVANDANTFATYEWDNCNNGVASVPTYTILVSDHDNDPNFAKAIEYTGSNIDVTVDHRKCAFTVKDFNAILNQLPTFQCGIMNIDVRVKSTLGIVQGNAFVQYSNPITFSVTGYSTSPKMLTFVKDAASPSTAPKLLSSGFASTSDYEGYMYLEAGSYKFYRPDACGSFTSPTTFGGSAGVLAEGSTTSISVATAGYYLVKADLTGLTYSVKYYKAFGIFGPAKGVLGSSNMVPMTADGNSNIWKLTIDLFKGKKFKFKSNDWTGALIGSPASVPPGATTFLISILGSSTTPNGLVEYSSTSPLGDITVPGAATDVPNKQKYDLVLDVSNPRKYTYTLTLNPN